MHVTEHGRGGEGGVGVGLGSGLAPRAAFSVYCYYLV